MAKELTMPALSPSMTEGTLVKWLKKEGDEIKTGEVIAEVETDKATMDLEAFESGHLLKIISTPGTRVTVNGRIAILGNAGEKVPKEMLAAAEVAPHSAPAVPSASKGLAPKLAPDSTPAPAPVSVMVDGVNGGRVKASPLAKKVARERGVSLTALAGSGPGGRILKRDVENAPVGGTGAGILPRTPVARDESIQLTNMRRTIARRLVESKNQIPHFYLEVEIDAVPLRQLRESLKYVFNSTPQNPKLSVNDFILKGCVEALRKVPGVNASFEGESIRQFGAVHMSFAVAIAEGLITPVIQNAHSKSIFTMSQEARTLTSKAKEGQLKPEEYTGGTFTVSNLGMMGIDRFSAIINPPQAAILAVGGVIQKAVVTKEGALAPGERMSLTLSCDHRVIDGAVGASFLKELKTLLENPSVLLL